MSKFTRSRIAASLQELVAKRREEVGLFAEVLDLIDPPSYGRLLEVGCGSGRQLKVLHERKPTLELYGLDLSGAAIRNASQNLGGIQVDLREGSIEKTNYEDDFFEMVTCFSSMSYWKNLIACFDEIHRILKSGGVARLVEPQQDLELEEVVETIKANLADESPLRRYFAVSLNKFGLRYGRRIGLKLYSSNEILDIAGKSRFGEAVEIKRVSLQNLPIFMLISLWKPIQEA